MSTAEELRAVPAADRPARRSARVGAVTLAAGVLICVQLGYRGWLAARGWFVGDDFAFIGRANALPLWSHAYLVQDYNGHVMPGAFLIVALYNSLWPFNFAPVVVGDLLLQAATSILFLALLRELFGSRPAILVPLGIFAFSPITQPAFVWWSAALNQLPQQLAMAAAMLLHVRYLRTGDRRRGWLAALAVAGGLLFCERTLLVVPFIAATTVLYFTAGPARRRLVTAWRRHWQVWTGYLVVVVPYGVYYLTAVPSPTRSGATSDGLIEVGTNMIGHALLPGLLGGPWHWLPIGANAAVADPPHVLVWVSITAWTGIIAASIALRRRALFAWCLLAGYAAVLIVLLTVSRAAMVGPLIGSEYRYSTELSMIGALAIALAFLPLRRGSARAQPQRLLPREPTRRRIAAVREAIPAADLAALRHLPRAPVPAALAVVAALLASSVVSATGYDRYWSHNLARTFIHNAAAGLRAAPHPLTVYDSAAPDEAVWALVHPYDRLSRLLIDVRPQPRYFVPGMSTAELVVADSTGTLRRAAVDGVRAVPGPRPGCGWYVTDSERTVPLVTRTFGWTWVVHIGYMAGLTVPTFVRAGSTTTPVVVRRGIHELFVYGTGAIGSVTIGGLGSGALCTDDITVGQVVAVPGSTP